MSKTALTHGEAVAFYTQDPKLNSQYVKLIEMIEEDGRLIDGEKQMLEWTVETIFGLGYVIYDHLWFHTHELMKDMSKEIALSVMKKREEGILKAVHESILPVVWERAVRYGARNNSSAAFGAWIHELQCIATNILQFSKRNHV